MPIAEAFSKLELNFPKLAAISRLIYTPSSGKAVSGTLSKLSKAYKFLLEALQPISTKSPVIHLHKTRFAR